MLQMDYRKLQIWQKGMEFAKFVYESLKIFPQEEIYGLTKQLKRAVVSVPSNIAEGSQRTSNKDFANFILIAKGSLAEVETQCELAHALGFLEEKSLLLILEKSQELHRMMYAFHSKLVTKDS